MIAILSWTVPLAVCLAIALAYWWLMGKLWGPMVQKNRQRPDWRTTPEERERVDQALAYLNRGASRGRNIKSAVLYEIERHKNSDV